MRALVVDDDPVIVTLVQRLLEEEGYTVSTASTLAEGRALALAEPPTVLVLDLRLPDGVSIPLVQAMRRAKQDTPILVLTATSDSETTVLALDAGADDYQVKPVDPAAFKARVRALVRRGGARRTEQLAAGNLRLDRLARTALIEGVPIDLTPRELAFLEYFLLNAGQLITRATLLREVLHLQHDPGTNIVDVNLMRLRKKLERAGATTRIIARRGLGFVLDRRAD